MNIRCEWEDVFEVIWQHFFSDLFCFMLWAALSHNYVNVTGGILGHIKVLCTIVMVCLTVKVDLNSNIAADSQGSFCFIYLFPVTVP
jgi:hypothetical protein